MGKTLDTSQNNLCAALPTTLFCWLFKTFSSSVVPVLFVFWWKKSNSTKWLNCPIFIYRVWQSFLILTAIVETVSIEPRCFSMNPLEIFYQILSNFRLRLKTWSWLCFCPVTRRITRIIPTKIYRTDIYYRSGIWHIDL